MCDEPRLQPLAYSMTDACKVSGLGRTTLWRAIHMGHLRAKRSSRDTASGEGVGRTLILHRELEAYLEALPDA